MIWSEIRTLSRLKLADGSKIWTDADLLGYANTALNDLTKDSEAHLKRYSFEVTEGTRRYTLPTDCYEVRNVKLNGLPIVGTRSHSLEDWDSQYLTRVGDTEFFYIEDSRSIAFCRVADWTEDYTVATFDSEYGVVTSIAIDSTYATFDSEDGVVVSILDTTGGTKYVANSWNGAVTGFVTGPFVVQITYVYQPAEIVNDADTPDLPGYMHYGLHFGVLRQAFARPGQGHNPKLAKWYGDRYEEYAKYWRKRNLEWAHGEDQMITQHPATWGTDFAKKMWRT